MGLEAIEPYSLSSVSCLIGAGMPGNSIEDDMVQDIHQGGVMHYPSELSKYTREERIAIIYGAEATLFDVPEENRIDLPSVTEHFFADKIYGRKLFLEKGSWLTGKVHRYNDILIVAKGDVTFFTEHETRRMIGPCHTIVRAGTKPLLRANEDTTFYNAHPNPTDERDLDILEEYLIIPGDEDINSGVTP